MGQLIELEPRICQQGLVFVNRGVELVLSHDQLQIMALLKHWESEPKKELRDSFFGRDYYGGRKRQPLTAAERAAFCRTVLRLEEKHLLTQHEKPETWIKRPLNTPLRLRGYTCLALTEEGRTLIVWLTECWDGWPVYLKHFGGRWSQAAKRDAAMTAEEWKKDRAAKLAELATLEKKLASL